VPSQQLLFRQAAIDFQQHNRQWGRVALLQPLSTKIITWFIVATVALIITFLFLAQYARKETVVGYLTPSAGTRTSLPKPAIPSNSFQRSWQARSRAYTANWPPTSSA
jgi:hypothetical protein